MCCASLLETVTKNSAAAWRARSSLGLSHLSSLHLTSASLPRACHLVLRDHPRSCYERKFRESSQRRCGGAASVLSLRSSLSARGGSPSCDAGCGTRNAPSHLP